MIQFPGLPGRKPSQNLIIYLGPDCETIHQSVGFTYVMKACAKMDA